MDKKDLHSKFIDLMNTSVDESNDLGQLNELNQVTGDFSLPLNNSFTDGIWEQLNQNSISGKIVEMYSRFSMAGAAAILLLVLYSWYSDGMLSSDSLMGLTQIDGNYLWDTDYSIFDSFSQ